MFQGLGHGHIFLGAAIQPILLFHIILNPFFTPLSTVCNIVFIC